MKYGMCVMFDKKGLWDCCFGIVNEKKRASSVDKDVAEVTFSRLNVGFNRDEQPLTSGDKNVSWWIAKSEIFIDRKKAISAFFTQLFETKAVRK